MMISPVSRRKKCVFKTRSLSVSLKRIPTKGTRFRFVFRAVCPSRKTERTGRKRTEREVSSSSSSSRRCCCLLFFDRERWETHEGTREMRSPFFFIIARSFFFFVSKTMRKKANPFIFRQNVVNPFIFALFATFYFYIPEKTSTSSQLKPNKHTR